MKKRCLMILVTSCALAGALPAGQDVADDTTSTWEGERGPRPESGYIGIQNYDERSVVSFKEISVRETSRGGADA